MKNVLITFTADTSGLDPAIDALDGIKNAEKGVIEEARKVGQAMEKSAADSEKAFEGTGSTLAELDKALANLSKSAVGAAFKQAFKDIRESLRMSAAEAEAFYQSIIKNSKQALLQPGTTEEVKQLEAMFEAATLALEEMQQEARETAAALGTTAAASRELQEAQSKLADNNVMQRLAAFKELLDEIATKEKLGLEVDQQSIEALREGTQHFRSSYDELQKLLALAGEDLSAKISVAKENIAATSEDVKRLGKELEALAPGAAKLDLEAEFRAAQAALEEETVALKYYEEQLKGVENTQKTLSKTIADSDKVIARFDGTANRLRTRLNEIRDELTRMEMSGETNTARFRELTKEAAELNTRLTITQKRIRNLSSESAGIDALVTGVQGLVGVFAAAQGAVALMGDETEEMQQALLKTNAALSLLQGVQAATNALKKDSALMTAREVALQKIQIAQTQLATAAESRNIVVRYAAIAAQRALNAVMATNPYGLALLAIASLVTITASWTRNTREAAKAQAELGAALDATTRLLDAQIAGIQRAQARQIADMKARGAADDEITERVIRNQELITAARRQQLAESEAQLAKFKDTESEQYKELADAVITLQQQIADDELKIYEMRSEQARKAYLDQLKSARAFAEAQVIVARQGTREAMRAEISAIRARAKEALAATNLTAGERVKIEQETAEAIRQVELKYHRMALADAKAAIDAKLADAKEGSREELDLRIAQMRAQMEIELNATDISEAQRLAIIAKYRRQEADMLRAFNRQMAKDAVNSRIAEIQAQIDREMINSRSHTNAQVIRLQSELIEEQARLEVLDIQQTVHNEKLRANMIAAVWARARSKQEGLRRQFREAQIAEEAEYQHALFQLEATGLRKVLATQKLTARERRKIQTELHGYERAAIQADQDALEARYAAGLLSEEQFQIALMQIRARYLQQDISEWEAAAQRKAEIQRSLTATMQNVMTAFSAQNQKIYNREIERTEHLRDKQLITEEEYNRRMKEIRRKQDADAKAQAMFQMLIQQGPMMLKAFSEGGWVGIAAALALFSSLLASLVGTSAPGYKHGVVDIKGPGTSTSDSIPARLSKGESVITAEATRKWGDALRAMNADKFEQWIMSLPKTRENLFNKISGTATMATLPKDAYKKIVNNNTYIDIDYNRLGEAVATHIAANPSTHISLDENGFNVSVKKGLDRITYMNKRITR